MPHLKDAHNPKKIGFEMIYLKKKAATLLQRLGCFDAKIQTLFELQCKIYFYFWKQKTAALVATETAAINTFKILYI